MDKKEVKIPGIWKTMISRPNYGQYECNFWHFYTIFICAYDNRQKFDPNITKGQKGKIYRNLTQNITKGQIRVKMDKKEVKIPGIWKTMISRPNYGMYECIFGIFTQFLQAHMTIDRNLTQNITKGQKGSKRVKKG